MEVGICRGHSCCAWSCDPLQKNFVMRILHFCWSWDVLLLVVSTDVESMELNQVRFLSLDKYWESHVDNTWVCTVDFQVDDSWRWRWVDVCYVAENLPSSSIKIVETDDCLMLGKCLSPVESEVIALKVGCASRPCGTPEVDFVWIM